MGKALKNGKRRPLRIFSSVEEARYAAIQREAEKMQQLHVTVSDLVYRWIDEGMKRDGVKW